MPVSITGQHEHLMSPPLVSTTPARQSFIRSSSNNTSYSPTVTATPNQHRLNVVTRVAIEGKAKRGQDGASVRMFLKISLPLDSVSPGATIPLFPEENIKVLSSQVHPLDQNSVPYNFSSSISPLLHNAARALNLPARSSESFQSTFHLSKSNGHTSSTRSSKIETSDAIPPIDVQYTGQISVSGYSISFVLPKVFLSRRRTMGTPSDNEDDGLSQTPLSRRRSSIGERNQAQYMAAIDMWIPFLCKPPRSPYLLSIPSPRCLHNHIKLRIFPPTNTSASFASLSSVEEDGNAWDLTSDPHVTRSATTRPSRSGSHTHFADDESSDSSNTGMTDACVIQGTFPSSERIRVRWAKPMKYLNIPGFEPNGRRRVGVEEVNGEIVCNVHGKGTSASNQEIEGVLMNVEYKGQCKGVWFPGVATLLGLDVGLEAKGSDVSWPQGYPSRWVVSGAAGYTGFDTGSGGTASKSKSRESSFDSNGPQIQIPEQTASSQPYQTARTSSTSSTSSLLRGPLPAQNIADYSFEGSNATLPSSSLSPAGTLSSISSIPTSSTPNLPPPPQTTHPGSPITLHINMNEFQAPAKNSFTFNISGTILVTARTTISRVNLSLAGGDKPVDPEPIVLPRFTVLAADNESTSTVVRNEVEGAAVEVFHPTGDIHNDAQARKTVLQKAGSTRCGEDGGRIALKLFDNHATNGFARPSNRPRTPSNNTMNRISTTSPITRMPFPSRGKREGPPMIACVQAVVTTLSPEEDVFPSSYAVRLTLRSPALAEPEWLEFGFAKGPRSSNRQIHRPSKVHVICASLDGVPVKAEISNVARADTSAVDHYSAPFEGLSDKNWLSWGKVYTGTSVGGSIVLDYIVKNLQGDASEKKKKRDARANEEMQVLLPTFFMSVARFEVTIDAIPGFIFSPSHSNFNYYHATPTGSRLLQYSLEEFAKPQLSLLLAKSPSKTGIPIPAASVGLYLTWIFYIFAFLWMYHVSSQIQQLSGVQEKYSDFTNAWFDTPTVTVTTTVFTNPTTKRWFGDPPLETVSTSIEPSPRLASTSETALKRTDQFSTANSPIHTSVPLTGTSLTNTPAQSILENFGLVPIQHMFTFTWTDEHLDALKGVVEQVVETLEVIWTIFRKAYHYPLDPP